MYFFHAHGPGWSHGTQPNTLSILHNYTQLHNFHMSTQVWDIAYEFARLSDFQIPHVYAAYFNTSNAQAQNT